MKLRKFAASTLVLAAVTFSLAATHASAQTIGSHSTVAAADPINPNPQPPPPDPAI